MNLEQENEALRRANAALREALERASNGLAWYRAEFPDADSPADDEMQAEIDAALAADAGKDFVSRDTLREFGLRVAKAAIRRADPICTPPHEVLTDIVDAEMKKVTP